MHISQLYTYISTVYIYLNYIHISQLYTYITTIYIYYNTHYIILYYKILHYIHNITTIRLTLQQYA